MALVTPFWFLDILLLIVGIFVAFYARFKLYTQYFWKKRNVAYEQPTFFFGNLFRNERFYGMWMFTRPMIVIRDLTLVKNVLVKDFQHFHDRGIKFDPKYEPMSGNLVNMEGSHWRNLRVKLTPTFTSGKLKMMFATMRECGDVFEKYLHEFASRGETVEMKDLLARLNTDVISSCAFGIETNSIQNPDAEFRVYGRMVFKPTFWIMVSGILMNIYPEINKIITLRQFPTECTKFFMRVVKETVSFREKNNVKRKDFMDLLIQLKNKGFVEDADTKYLDENDGEKADGDPFTDNLLAAQAFVFYAAGFETSSTAMMFVLYEMAKNPDLQHRVQKEVDCMMAKHGGKTYEALQEMDLLDRCIQESLRTYAAMPLLIRECTKDYKIPDSDYVIEKGLGLIIPITGLHNDPEYFPDPDKFDPDRFLPEEKAKRDHFAYLPFGEGPRICIGNRFALLQSKIGLVSVLSKYEVHVATTTEIPFKFDPKSFFPTSKNGMPLKITLRNKI